MKKTLSILVLLLALTMVLPATIALNETSNQTNSTNTTMIEENYNGTDSNSTSDNYQEETEQEVEVMSTSHGAEMRLLQLQYSIEKQTLSANKIIELIQEDSPDVDVSELQAIVDNMNSLLEEVKAESQNVSDNAVEVFVDYKKQATDLSKDFRDNARKLVSPEVANKIRNRIKNEVRLNAKQLKDRIKFLRGKVNSERVKNFLGEDFAKNHPELSAQIESGEITPQKARDILTKEFQNMTQSQKSKVVREIKEKQAKVRVRVTAKVSELLNQQAERISQRLHERAQKMSDEGKEQAARVLERQSERIRERAENASENIKSRVKEHLRSEREDMKDKFKEKLSRNDDNQENETLNNNSAGNSEDEEVEE